MTAVTLYLPGLLPKVKGSFAEHPLSELQLPALQKLLSRAEVIATKSLEQLLTGSTVNFPYAALRALGEGLNSEDAWWLCADPIQLMIDQASVYLWGHQHLKVSVDEKELLMATIKPLLPDAAILQSVTPRHWYITLPQSPALKTYPLQQVIGKDITPYLPYGDAAASWKRLLTEIQMTLFNHPVNEKRREAAINSVWFWGEGCLSEITVATTWQKIWSDSAILKGFAQSQQFSYVVFNDLIDEKFSQAGDYLIALSTLEDAVLHGQMSVWQKFLQQLDTQLFLPLITALLQKNIHEVVLYDKQAAYRITRSCLTSWWRRKKTLEIYVT